MINRKLFHHLWYYQRKKLIRTHFSKHQWILCNTCGSLFHLLLWLEVSTAGYFKCSSISMSDGIIQIEPLLLKNNFSEMTKRLMILKALFLLGLKPRIVETKLYLHISHFYLYPWKKNRKSIKSEINHKPH